MAHRALAAARAATTIVLAAAAASVSAQRSLEYEVKAAYVYNIANFVTWPPDAFAGPADPLRVCVYGDDPFGPALDRAVQSGPANQRPIVAERLTSADGLARCHLIFLAGANTDRIDQAVKFSAQRPILTVGETPDFLRRGGIIAFVVDGGRVRFDVNAAAASTRGLALSSRLLQVARTVTGKNRS